MLEDLKDICASLDLTLEDGQASALLQYLALLQRWNTTFNLTAIRNPQAMLAQHLADCLAVIPSLRRHGVRGRLLDAGSGGGLPGVVIAIMIPGLDVTCVDSVAKKTAFVRQAAGELALGNLHAAHARVETLHSMPFDVATSRAFASLSDFTRLTRDQVKAGGVWLAMKGHIPIDEITNLPDGIEVFHVEPLQVPRIQGPRCLVWMRRSAHRPDGRAEGAPRNLGYACQLGMRAHRLLATSE